MFQGVKLIFSFCLGFHLYLGAPFGPGHASALTRSNTHRAFAVRSLLGSRLRKGAQTGRSVPGAGISIMKNEYLKLKGTQF